MNNQLEGIYAPYIKQYIDLKKSLGFKYDTETKIFSFFDRFTIRRRGENIVGITRDLSVAWCNMNPNESPSYKYHRCVCLNQLASYLCRMGFRSYIIQLPPNKNTFTPYIFSRKQVDDLFDACDSMTGKKKRMDSAIMILPALLRLLYGTGLRISEALSLKNKDINLDDNYLIVKDSKNGKERMIPISTSLSEVLKEYVKHRNLMPLSISKDDCFFITLSGSGCNRDHVRKWFRKILSAAGISRDDHGPRLHDLRYPNKNIIQTFPEKVCISH